jgi:hypothetical protein
MIHARNLTSVPWGVTFQFFGSKKFTDVRITLQSDLYNLHFSLIRRSRVAGDLVLNEKTFNMICAENLRRVFEDATGLAL